MPDRHPVAVAVAVAVVTGASQGLGLALAQEPALRVYSVDPGDMRTQMHQDAFPGEDISDRPGPEHAVPALDAAPVLTRVRRRGRLARTGAR